MLIWDISMTIKPDMQVYKNKEGKRPLLSIVSDHETSSIHESRISLDLHTGTHLDAPLHTIKDGSTIEKICVENLITSCRVLDLTSVQEKIATTDLEPFSIKEGEFILFKTRNSFTEQFDFKFVYLSEEGARFLKNRRIAGVGIDALGIERDQPGHPTHQALLGSGILILEGLRLGQVEAGEYTLIALPLKLEGVEASPVRAILQRF